MILFISDLHLDPERPAIARAFQAFLEGPARSASTLYILGDLFELWIGDDDDTPFVQEMQSHIRACADSGTPVFFMRGNRDFLIGDDFANNTGATLLEDPHLLEVNNQRWLLMHGDTLCTRDVDYQAFRQQSRQPAWMQQVLSMPLEERRALGRQLRQQSKTMASRKAEDIMDVTPKAVTEAMQQYRADILIHGHTHRPARHPVSIDGEEKERIVLGDWDKLGWCLRYEGGELVLESWAIE